jgi:hypothetical protein
MRGRLLAAVLAIGCTFSSYVDPQGGGTDGGSTSAPPDTGSGVASTPPGTTAATDANDTADPPGTDDDPTTGSPPGTGDTSTGDPPVVETDADSGSSSSSGSVAPPSCDDVFGKAPGYVLCEETDTTCNFAALTMGTCAQMCAAYGGTCLEAFDNVGSGGVECVPVRLSTDTCDTSRQTEICVCDKP